MAAPTIRSYAHAADRPVRPLTADDVLETVRADDLSEGDRVQVLQGAFTAMSRRTPHAIVVEQIPRG